MKNNKNTLYNRIINQVSISLLHTLNEALLKIETADNLKEFRDKINDTLVLFIFTKVNGDVRMAFGTADPDWLDYFNAPEKPQVNGYVVQFFDVEANGWRSMTLRNGSKTNIAFCQTFKTPKKLEAAIANEEERTLFVEEYMTLYQDEVNTDETPEEIADTVETTPVVVAAPSENVERKPRKPRSLNINTLNKEKLVLNTIIDLVKKEKEKGKSYIRLSYYVIFDAVERVLNKSSISIYNVWQNEEAFQKFLGTCYAVNVSPYKVTADISHAWSTSYLEAIIFSKPVCKEFEKLNKYLVNYLGVRALKDTDIYNEGVEGKRSTIFERYGRRALCYMPEKCNEIIKECRSTKKQNWNAKMDVKRYLYTGDRYNSYGEDMESEWNGYEEYYLIIKFYTPSGKEAKTLEFHV